jgi:hypothetical protein
MSVMALSCPAMKRPTSASSSGVTRSAFVRRIETSGVCLASSFRRETSYSERGWSMLTAKSAAPTRGSQSTAVRVLWANTLPRPGVSTKRTPWNWRRFGVSTSTMAAAFSLPGFRCSVT